MHHPDAGVFSMNFWIDKTSDSENVVISDTKSVLIGSVDRDHADAVASQLKDGEKPAAVLGTEGLVVIPFNQLQSVVSRNTDTTVDIKYRANKELVSLDINFENEAISQEFVDYINPYLPDTLAKTIYKQSSWVAAAPSLLAILSFLIVAFVYWNKFRLPIYIIGAVWMFFAGHMLIKRITNPPEITRWIVKGKAIRRAWGDLKTAGSFAFVLAVVCGISTQFPDSYGEDALYERVYHEMIVPASVPKLIANGADMYHADSDGDDALTLAIQWGEHDVAKAIIEAGYDVNRSIAGEEDGDTVLSVALYSGASDVAIAILDAGYDINKPIGDTSAVELAVAYDEYEVVERILDKGGLEAAEKYGFDIEATAVENASEYEDRRLLNLLGKHQKIQQTEVQVDL